MKRILFAMCLVMASCGETPQQADRESYGNLKAYQAMVLENPEKTVSEYDPEIRKLQNKIDALASKAGMTSDELADMAYYIKKEVVNKGKPSSFAEILDVIDVGFKHSGCPTQLKEANKQPCLAEWLALYATYRMSTDKTHEHAIGGFAKVLDVANDPEKMSQLTKLASD